MYNCHHETEHRMKIDTLISWNRK